MNAPDVATARIALNKPGKRNVRFSPAVQGSLYSLWVLGIAALVFAADRRGIAFGLLSRDPNDLAAAPFYAGALSNVGVLLWCAAASTAWLAAVALRGVTSCSSGAALLAGAGALSATFALDDTFMLHEVVLPTYFGVPELVVLATYAMVGSLWICVESWEGAPPCSARARDGGSVLRGEHRCRRTCALGRRAADRGRRQARGNWRVDGLGLFDQLRASARTSDGAEAHLHVVLI